MHRLIHSFSLLRPSISSIASISSSSSSPSLSCRPLRSSAPYRSMSASTAAASPSSSHYDYLVIGAGSGGLATARRAASYKARAAVIEQARVGGTCVNAGCVPKKLLFNAATIYETIRHHAREYGIEWPESANEEKSVTPNIKFNWKEFRERRNQYIDRLNGIYDSSLKKEGVDYIVGHAKLLGDNKVEVTGKNNEKTIYTASHITIAVGGEPLIPNIPGADLGITSDGFFDIIEQPKTVAIAGAGYIAVELAGIFKAFGCDVHLFIRYDSVLRSFDRFIIDGLTNEMKAAGIHIHNYSQIVGVEKNTDGQSLKLNIKQTSNAPSTHVSDASTLPSFDQLVWAIGRVPLTKTIGLDSVGIKTNEGGYIITDDYENTNINNYYAIGDVNGKAELTPVAIAAGRKLADRLFNGIKDSKLSYDNIPTVVFSHPPIGTIGMSEQQAVDEYGVDDIVLYKASFRNLYYGPLTEKVMTHMKLVCVKSLHEKVVGLHVVGMGADEMLQGFGVAIKMGATKKDLDSVVAIHPTAAEEFVTMKTPYPATAKPTPKL